MIKGTTSTGFEYEVSEKVANDYELVENLGELDKNPLILGTIVKQILGEKQTEKLKDHVRDEEGMVPTDRISAEIIEIFTSNNVTKNS